MPPHIVVIALADIQLQAGCKKGGLGWLWGAGRQNTGALAAGCQASALPSHSRRRRQGHAAWKPACDCCMTASLPGTAPESALAWPLTLIMHRVGSAEYRAAHAVVCQAASMPVEPGCIAVGWQPADQFFHERSKCVRGWRGSRADHVRLVQRLSSQCCLLRTECAFGKGACTWPGPPAQCTGPLQLRYCGGSSSGHLDYLPFGERRRSSSWK